MKSKVSTGILYFTAALPPVGFQGAYTLFKVLSLSPSSGWLEFQTYLYFSLLDEAAIKMLGCGLKPS